MLETRDALIVRKRFLEDFRFWAQHAAKIRTKKGQIAPLILNAVQERFLEEVLFQLKTTGRVRMVVLKARQQGLSTVISAFIYWWLSQHEAQKGIVIAHEADATATLFDMYKRLHVECPKLLRPETRYSSKTELVFSDLDTGIRVATAGGKGIARGETLQATHLSEVAFWPTGFAETNFNGMIEAVPEEDNTFVFVESTANGMTGKFRQLWVNAVEGRSVFRPFFAAWFETPEYRATAPEGFKRSPEEQQLAKEFSLDDEQLQWRRLKIGEKGTDLFRQEYPATADEAFLNTGRPVFHPDYIQERLRKPTAPIRRMAVTEGKVEPHPAGELLIYHELDNAETYCIGADVGMGVRNGDYSVAQVLDSQLRQVAVWRGLVHPDVFAKVLSSLGYYYNSCLIAPERNNHGILTAVRLRDEGYPFIYTDPTEGSLEPKDTIQIGFFTSERTKPLVIDKLRAVDRDREIEINDETTLRELLTFVVTESGRMEAEDGCHDDCVMALAIANHVHEGKYTPVPVTDDYYAQAI
jgi:hypothetical protein